MTGKNTKTEDLGLQVSDKVGKAAAKCACADAPNNVADALPKLASSHKVKRWELEVEWCLRLMT